MKTEIFFNGNVISIISFFKGNKPWKIDKNNLNYHIIEASFKGKSISFDYWAPHMFPKIYNDTGNIEALCCFLRDAEAGELSFHVFCIYYGYDLDEVGARATWIACRQSFAKASSLFPDYHKVLGFLSNKYKL